MCRALRADEIDVRVQSLQEDFKTKEVTGAILLLYKNARVDMDILDEEYGKLGWQRTHAFKDGKLYCTVSVWDEIKQQWISREDVGTESNTEAEKGQASDSFKRANVNFGIGRELYTAPSIWIDASAIKTYKDGKGYNKSKDKFSVVEIDIQDKQIKGLVIRNDSKGEIVYTYGTLKSPKTGNNGKPKQTPTKTENEPKTAPVKPTKALAYQVADGITVEMLFKVYKTDIDRVYSEGTAECKKAIDEVREYIAACKK